MIMKRAATFAVLGVTLLLGACQQYQWVNPSHPTANMSLDSIACEQSVARLYPYRPVVVQTSGPYVTSGYRSCYRTYYGRSCDYVPGSYVPPTYGTQDLNAGQRQASYNACLASKGWHLARTPN
jgi:hypothetical protein